MAAQDFDAMPAAADIVAALNLAAGTTYSVGNVSTTATLFLRSAATAPDADARGFRIESGATGFINGDEPVWVWTDDPSGCPVIVDVSV